MNKLYELKEMLCKELESYGSKDKLDMGSLEIVDKLAHAIKNICKIIESYEEYSGESYDGRSYGNSSYDGRSYARGGGRNSYSMRRRDSMGRYSGASELVSELRELMQDAPDQKTRQKFERFIGELESM